MCSSQRPPPLAQILLALEHARVRAGTWWRPTKKHTTIPITVRQLEAIVRISESLAKQQQKGMQAL